jgi:DNA-binding GntR family transcriptional regulator
VTLSDVAYSQIEEMITTLQLAPGQAISEAYLSSKLGIGRTPVREALQRLARDRLVVIHPRRGVVVSEINIKNQLKLLELRRELERLIARVSARRSTADERKMMREIAENMEEAAANNDEMLFVRLDRRFDLLFVKLARNEFLSDAIQPLQGLSRRFWFMHYKSAGDMPRTAKLHADVARAIANGDERVAMQASDNLVDYIEAFTKSTLTADS